jgi:hypothetical protein
MARHASSGSSVPPSPVLQHGKTLEGTDLQANGEERGVILQRAQHQSTTSTYAALPGHSGFRAAHLPYRCRIGGHRHRRKLLDEAPKREII